MIRKLAQISGAVLTAVLLFAATGSAQTFDVSGAGTRGCTKKT